MSETALAPLKAKQKLPGRRTWKPEHDEVLRELVAKKYGKKGKWVEISKEINSRLGCNFNSKQCRTRYQNVLDDTIKAGPISSEEAAIIDEALQKYGKAWTTIAKILDGRTDNQVKNYYHAKQRRLERQRRKEEKNKSKSN